MPASEALQIPESVRLECYQRDQLICRCCGVFQGERAGLHHILFGGGEGPGMGGRRRHVASEIVTVCWLPGSNDCHRLLHGRKLFYQPFALEVVKHPGLTILQLMRWEQRAARRLTHGNQEQSG